VPEVQEQNETKTVDSELAITINEEDETDATNDLIRGEKNPRRYRRFYSGKCRSKLDW